MAWFPIANTVPQYWKQAADGTNEYSGAVLKAYQVGTITNIPFATDNTGGTTANSIALNANGNPEVSGNVVIPHLDQDYKLALYPDQTSADADSGATWTIDDLDLMGFDSGSLNPEHATDTGTDTYESATNTSAPDSGTEVVRDFQSTNSTTTPTLDSITLKDRDGNPLYPGAINGAHRLYYDGTDYLVLDLRSTAGVVDPEHATDSGTDTYVSATNTTAPAAGVQIVRDFQSANTTTTPTLDSLTITTRDGSALWANALSGPHTLQLASDSGSWLVLDPNPSEQRDFTRAASATQRGDVELATDAETQTGTDTERAVTPAGAASTYARIATGTYTGDGTTSQSITGIGFSPKFVQITTRETVDDTGAVGFFTTDQIVDDNAAGGAILENNTGLFRFDISRIISLDADGFTVDDESADSHPNQNGTVYNFMAIG